MQGCTRFFYLCGLDCTLVFIMRTNLCGYLFMPPDDARICCLCPRYDKSDTKSQEYDSTSVRIELVQEKSWHKYQGDSDRCTLWRSPILCAHRGGEDEQKEDFSLELKWLSCKYKIRKDCLELAEIWKFVD